jgi:hypothetical protein
LPWPEEHPDHGHPAPEDQGSAAVPSLQRQGRHAPIPRMTQVEIVEQILTLLRAYSKKKWYQREYKKSLIVAALNFVEEYDAITRRLRQQQ